MNKTLILLLLLIVTLLSSCNNNLNNLDSASTTVSGAGATFPYPFYNIVFRDYMRKHEGTTINYGAIGSGGGIRSLRDQSVDFGASDAFLNEKEVNSMDGEVLHIPTCMGGVVLAYTLSYVDSLKLSGPIIADIFMGKITQWDDPQIVAINPGIILPEKEIIPVYRSDGSGTTFVFSEYLSKVSPQWEKLMGKGKSLKWDVGLAAKGNPGVASIVQLTEGAIGYIGSEYALTLRLPTASIKNKAGNFVKASLKSISAAADVKLPDDMKTSITDMPNPDAYPISLFTWLLAYENQSYGGRSKKEAQALVDLLNYVISPEGQKVAVQINYAPLSEQALQKTQNLINKINFAGEKLSTIQTPEAVKKL